MNDSAKAAGCQPSRLVDRLPPFSITAGALAAGGLRHGSPAAGLFTPRPRSVAPAASGGRLRGACRHQRAGQRGRRCLIIAAAPR